MNTLNIILILIHCAILMGIEFYFFNNHDYENNLIRFDILFSVFSLTSIIYAIYINLSNKTDLLFVFWLNISIVIYALASNYLVFGNKLNIKFDKNKRKMIPIIIVLIFVFISLFLHGYLGTIYQGGIFSSADWFSSTFLNMMSDDSVRALVGLMSIGSLTVMIGKARGSDSYLVAGYFLIIMLPLFSVYDTFFTDLEIVLSGAASDIYYVFQNQGLALIIYIYIEIIFYSLLCAIALAFINMVKPHSLGFGR